MKLPKLILLIVILGIVLRFVKIGEIPYGFDGDEAAFGYYGYSLLTNLSDEYGNKLPLFFPSIGDYKYPVYAYLTTLPVAIFGLSEFSSRFISASAGTLLIVITYFITQRLFSSKKISFTAAFLVAISPYGIMFSRGAFESNLATLWIALGVWMLFEYSEAKRLKYLFLSGVLFVLSFFTYSATRVFIPAFIIFFGIHLMFDKKLKVGNKRNYLIFSLLLILVVSLAFLDPRSRVRALDISIFGNYKISENIRQSIWEDGISIPGNVFLTRIFHNKVLAHSYLAFKGYLAHFAPTYLFAESNPLIFKYSIPGVGLFYFFEFATFLLGIVALTKSGKSKSIYILALWIFLSPLASALTIETPNPIRALSVFPALEILSATGLIYLLNVPKYKTAKVFVSLIVGLIVLGNFFYFYHQYFIHDKYHEPWNTDGGMRKLVASVGQYENKYQKVIIPDDPYIFFLFYNKVSPDEFIKEAKLEKVEIGKWEYVNEFKKLVFKMPTNCPKIGRLQMLYVCKGVEIPQNSIVLDVIRFSDGVPAYTLIEFVPYSQRKNATLPEGLNYMVDTDLAYDEGLLPQESERYW